MAVNGNKEKKKEKNVLETDKTQFARKKENASS